MTNYVLAGDFLGNIHISLRKGLYIEENKFFGPRKKLYITKETVESYEVIDEDSHKSVSSGVARGIVGAAVLGPIGAVAGAASAKNKSEYKVSIVFKDGRRCLCSLDKMMYRNLVEDLY